MIVDVIVLAGGRSTRLGGTPKAGLVVDGSTLLHRTLAAVAGARRTVVVGPPDLDLPEGVLRAREHPPHSGPVAGIAAGLAALRAASATPSDATLVLACDMPRISAAIAPLLNALSDSPDVDGAIAVDETGHRQPLAAIYRSAALSTTLGRIGARGTLADLPVFRMLDTLILSPVTVPSGATADVDTWSDADTLGATRPRSKE